MSIRNNMEIGNRLAPIFFALLMLSMLVVVRDTWKNIQNEKNANAALSIPLATERLVSDWSSNITSTIMRTMIRAHSTDAKLIAFFSANASAKRNDELIKLVEEKLDTNQEKILFAKIVEIRNAYHAVRDSVLHLKSNGKTQEAVTVLEHQYLPLSQRYHEAVYDLLQLQRAQVNAESFEIAHAKAFGPQELIAMTVLAFLAGAVFCWWLKGVITRSQLNSGKSALTDQQDSFYEILA